MILNGAFVALFLIAVWSLFWYQNVSSPSLLIRIQCLCGVAQYVDLCESTPGVAHVGQAHVQRSARKSRSWQSPWLYSRAGCGRLHSMRLYVPSKQKSLGHIVVQCKDSEGSLTLIAFMVLHHSRFYLECKYLCSLCASHFQRVYNVHLNIWHTKPCIACMRVCIDMYIDKKAYTSRAFVFGHSSVE